MNLSIILPCFNEEENITYLYQEFNKINFRENEYIELLFVQNGSSDNTESEIISVINQNDKKNIKIKMVKLINNLGYGGGLKKGIEAACGEYIAWAHADLQTPLEDIYRLYNIIKNDNYSFGKGKRVNNRGYDGIVSRFHEKCASFILNEKMVEINAQPKIFHKSIIRHLTQIPERWTVIDTYIYYVALKKKINIYEIDVVFKNRIYGSSKWKNNYKIFLKHLFYNFIYLFKLRFLN